MQEEYFGEPGKVALMRRAADLYRLVQHDPRFAYYGRTVALSEPTADTTALLTALASLLGASVCYRFPKRDAEQLFDGLKAAGLATDRLEHFGGDEAAFQASRDVVAAGGLPADITVRRLDDASPTALVRDVAAMLQACDVMPVPGSVLRGRSRRGITLVAIDGAGEPVASASSFFMHHPDSALANDVFWGMLATRPDRRGQRIALHLGAMAIEHMWTNEGARGFMTGVRLGNQSSQALCNRLGVRGSEWIYANCLDPVRLGSSTITR